MELLLFIPSCSKVYIHSFQKSHQLFIFTKHSLVKESSQNHNIHVLYYCSHSSDKSIIACRVKKYVCFYIMTQFHTSYLEIVFHCSSSGIHPILNILSCFVILLEAFPFSSICVVVHITSCQDLVHLLVYDL